MLDGGTWTFLYSGDYLKSRNPEVFLEVEPSNSTSVKDPLNQISGYQFVATSPYSMTDSNGNTTSYRYSGGADFATEPGYATSFGSKLQSATLPEGNGYAATYGLRNVVSSQTMKAKPGSGLPDLTVSFGFVSTCDAPNTRQACAKPLWKRDAKLNQTDYTYTTWGGLLTEMLPAASANTARPLKVLTYAQKYAYVRNSSNALVQAATPIWMLQSETLCETVTGANPAATCNPSAQQTVTTYEYGANGTADNLLVRGKVVTADGTSLRTCYGYDWRGNKIWETAPRAGLSSCP